VISSIKVQYSTAIDVLGPNFMPICAVTKKCEFIGPVGKKLASPSFYAPLTQGAKVRFEFGLHTPVKFYPDSLRYVGVIREQPILSKYILCSCCHAYA